MAKLCFALFAAICASAAAQVPVPVLLSAQPSSQPPQVLRYRQPSVVPAETRTRVVSRPSAASLAAANLLEEASSYVSI